MSLGHVCHLWCGLRGFRGLKLHHVWCVCVVGIVDSIWGAQELTLHCDDMSASLEEVKDKGEGLPGQFFWLFEAAPYWGRLSYCKGKTPVVNEPNDGVSFTTVGGILSKYIEIKRAVPELGDEPVGGILRGKSKDPPTGMPLHMNMWLCLSN